MPKNIVLVTQEENWQDSGGDHDPEALTVSDDDYDRLQELAADDPQDVSDELIDIVHRSKLIKEFPVMIDRVITIWYKY